MTIGDLLRRAAAVPPLVPALACAGIVTVANLSAIVPDNLFFGLIAGLLWLAATVTFFIFVTWYRDDDWLAAGFLFGITTTLADFLGLTLVEVVVQRSLLVAVVLAPGAFFGVVIRSVIAVPVTGALIALARWIGTRLRRRAPEPASAAHPITKRHPPR